jgi:hypothetical protein
LRGNDEEGARATLPNDVNQLYSGIGLDANTLRKTRNEIPVQTGIQYPAGSFEYWMPASAGISNKAFPSQLIPL